MRYKCLISAGYKHIKCLISAGYKRIKCLISAGYKRIMRAGYKLRLSAFPSLDTKRAGALRASPGRSLPGEETLRLVLDGKKYKAYP